MDYRFENLGPEKFQEFCQALMTKEHSTIQCFPVGQPDGGRDGILYFEERSSKSRKDFAVIQIKYVRNPESVLEPHKWLVEIMSEEAPKLKKLIPKGARYYYLITNVRGTAHLDNGSIDKMQKILDDNLQIPNQCIWRDDLCRKVDNAWDLKWNYPEIMNGNDLLRLIVENGLNSDNSRRTNAIRTYVRTQYDIDQKVKFKQVELQNSLFDLFIDGPLEIKLNKENFNHFTVFKQTTSFEHRFSDYENNILIGAAQLIINEESPKIYPYVVIEGGPGQGKSTLSQFICQVHRVKLLQEEKILKNLSEEYIPTSIRVPFKVDLRDYATWLEGKDPFSSLENNIKPENWNKALESFLAAQVSHFSGGSDFNVNDLQSIAKISAMLLVLDGLDEVANISIRKDIVDEVLKGVHRLKELSASLQVIVTSRPTAFANTEGFPEDEFHYLRLVSLTDALIHEYTEKWLKAKRIHGKEASDVKKILEEKLVQPHLRDLARSPMQLSILLSLIHTRGSSLPDKRTALYDNYVDLFFARESEKNLIVREHRDILIDIHRYLAWTLHSEVEVGLHKGSISTNRLQLLLSNYLENEGYDQNLCRVLFTGVVERVVFLVSRVEGTYEFEVQPLREYFAARHLFETAPYSPPGAERSGTRPDRFDAISRNFYWLNVTRFFAGCYSKGELPSLIDRLQELVREPGMNNLSHPRVLASVLLSDWVFAQHPKSMREAVKIILDGIGSRYVFNNEQSKRSSVTSLVLPQNCGKEQLIEECIQLLLTFPPRDYAQEIIEILRTNINKEENRVRWLREYNEVKIENRITWIEYGFYMGVYTNLGDAELDYICSLLNKGEEIALNYFFRAGKIKYISADQNKSMKIVEGIIEGDINIPLSRRSKSILVIMSQIFNLELYGYLFRHPGSYSFENLINQIMSISNIEMENTVIFEQGQQLVDLFFNESKKTTEEWSSSLTPWHNLIEESRRLFGERWAINTLANISAGIKSVNEKCKEYDVLFDHSQSLSYRVRHARMRYSSQNWWRKQFDSAKNDNDLMLAALIFITWASISTQIALSEFVDEKLNGLSKDSWIKVVSSAKRALDILGNTRLKKINVNDLPEKLSEWIVVSIGMRVNDEIANDLYFKYFRDYNGQDPVILSFCQKSSMEIIFSDSLEWEHALLVIKRNYQNRSIDTPDIFRNLRFYRRANDEQILPSYTALKILEEPSNYPRSLVIRAESRCRIDYSEKIIPVAEIANRENWFPVYETTK